MRLVSVRELRAKSGEVLDAAGQEDVVVTSNGKPIALILPVEGGDLERALALLRRARAQEAVTRLRERSAALGNDHLDAGPIDAEIVAARQARQRS